MKKTLIIALAGIMLFAFTQCGGDDSKKNGGKDDNDKEESVKGSTGYKAAKKMLKDWETAISKAESCDDLQNTAQDFSIEFEKFAKNYSEKDLSEDENKEMEKITNSVLEKYNKKAEELCDSNDSKGTEAYKSAKKLLSELESSLYTATTCDDLVEASNRFIDKASEIDEDSFTEEEKEKLEKQVQDLLAKVEAKSNELCNNDYVEDNPNGSNSDGSSVISTVNRLFNDYERALDNARTCDDIEKAADDFEKAMKALDSKYPDYEMSESEQKEIEELTERLISKAIEKTKQLCK